MIKKDKGGSSDPHVTLQGGGPSRRMPEPGSCPARQDFSPRSSVNSLNTFPRRYQQTHACRLPSALQGGGPNIEGLSRAPPRLVRTTQSPVEFYVFPGLQWPGV